MGRDDGLTGDLSGSRHHLILREHGETVLDDETALFVGRRIDADLCAGGHHDVLVEDRVADDRPRADLDAAIMVGAVERVRPKMMTVVAIMAGLMPILWAHGTGSEVMSRIAVPMIGGMVSSTILTLVVIPAVYALIKERGIARTTDLNAHARSPVAIKV